MSHLRVISDFAALLAVTRRRRVPAQARSRARVQRLLDTVDEIIGTHGFAALTIPLLAARADVQIGTVYQFFPDKTAIVEAVAERYMQLFAAEMAAVADRVVALSWNAAVDLVVEHFASMYRDNPTFRELWLHGHLTPGLREHDRRNNDELARLLAEVLARRPEFDDSAALHLASRMAIEAADGLLRYAFTLEPRGDPAVIREIKRMLSGYLLHAAHLQRRRRPR